MTVLILVAFRAQGHEHFQEIDVERLNIVEPGGTTRLVLTNAARSPGLIDKKAPFGDTAIAGKRSPIIFYNDDGTEAGGIGVRGHRLPNGPSAHGGLSFDRFEQEDVVMLDYDEEGGHHSQGLKVADRSNTPLREILASLAPIERMKDGAAKRAATAQWQSRYGPHAGGAVRVFVGRDTSGNAALDLRDAGGKTRLRLTVDSLGSPRIEFVDSGGKVTRTIK
jgi:hypothetical protein